MYTPLWAFSVITFQHLQLGGPFAPIGLSVVFVKKLPTGQLLQDVEAALFDLLVIEPDQAVTLQDRLSVIVNGNNPDRPALAFDGDRFTCMVAQVLLQRCERSPRTNRVKVNDLGYLASCCSSAVTRSRRTSFATDPCDTYSHSLVIRSATIFAKS